MNFFGRYAAVILAVFAVLLVGMLLLDVALPLVNDIRENLSTTPQNASPQTTVM